VYTFFTIFGFLFIVIASILINYIYNVFSINKVTNYFYPTNGRNVLNEINITVLPIIVWGFVELPVLSDNSNFILSVILNILVACAIMYEIKYGIYVLLKKENKFVDIISIIVATTFGQLVSYMILKSNPIIDFGNISYIISIIGIILLLGIHSTLILKTPLSKIKKEADEVNNYKTSALMDVYIENYSKKLWMLKQTME